jgi:catalase
MANQPTLTEESGAPVADNQRSQSAGPAGPLLLQDHHLIEKLAKFDRERIPERVVHARGSGATAPSSSPATAAPGPGPGS